MNERITLLQTETRAISGKMRDAEAEALEQMRASKARWEEEIAAMVERLSKLDLQAAQASRLRIKELNEEAGRFDDKLEQRDVHFFEEITRRQSDFETREVLATELLAQRLAHIRHGGEVGFAAVVDPAPELPRAERLFIERRDGVCKPFAIEPDEVDRARLGSRLSVQLSAVRKVLGGGIIADRETVALDRGVVDVDVFQLLDDARHGNDQRGVDRYGEFLPEQRYDDWASGLRERARTAFTTSAHRLLTAAHERDDHTSMVALAERLIDADPNDQLAHASLIDALDAVGDAAAADRARERRA